MPVVRSVTRGNTDADKIRTTILEVFGPEQLPEPKDISSVRKKMSPSHGEDCFFHEEKEDWPWEEANYEEAWWRSELYDYEDTYYTAEYDWYDGSWQQ